MRSEFENWFKTTEAYNLIEEMNYFKIDLFTFKEHRSQYQHSAVQIAYMTYQHQQTKVDELQAMFVEQARTASNQQAKIDELQKRVDVALKITGDNLRYVSQNHRDIFKPLLMTMIRSFKELEQALKGDE